MAKFGRAEIREILGDAHTDEIENRLIALHLGVVDPLRDKNTELQADLDKLKGVQAELDTLKTGDWQKKYEAEHQSLEKLKADVATKEQAAAVEAAYKKLLEDSDIDGKRIATIIRATKFDGMKLGKDGKFENEADLRKAIDADWSDFKVQRRTDGAGVDNPPEIVPNNGANPRAAEIAKAYRERKYGKAPEAKTTENN